MKYMGSREQEKCEVVEVPVWEELEILKIQRRGRRVLKRKM
jgi:hypothetical protein